MPRGGIWAYDPQESIIDHDRSSYRAKCSAHARGREAAICTYESVVRRALIIVTGDKRYQMKYHRDYRSRDNVLRMFVI